MRRSDAGSSSHRRSACGTDASIVVEPVRAWLVFILGMTYAAVRMRRSDFFANVSRFGGRTALVEESGEITTYRALAARASAFVDALRAHAPKLVFLEIANTAASLAAYVGCLEAGHPVLLLAEHQATDDLIARYRPNVVVRANNVIEQAHDDAHALHPRLRLLLSTSGSTGSPKLVKLSADNLQSNAKAIAAYLGVTSDDRALTTLKPHYSYGLSVIHTHLLRGASLLLTERSVTDDALWDFARRFGATSFAGVPHTFEAMEQKGVRVADVPSVHVVTQAGGRLPPAHVQRLAAEGRRDGFRFFVMYGQTEAAPRMAYLPPEQAEVHPSSIGVPIPGGSFELVDDDGAPIDATDVPGQLVYRGPNVMMGYAEQAADLAIDATPERLFTGDIAQRDVDGLYTIVGRASRFVKPFGVRVSLDDLEAHSGALCAGTDERIVIAWEQESAPVNVAGAAAAIAARHRLPPHVVTGVVLAQVPRLSSGKVDYRAIGAQGAPAGDTMPASLANAPMWRRVTSRWFLQLVLREAAEQLGVRKKEGTTVEALYATLLGCDVVERDKSFADLGGDSLTYVEAMAGLEALLGRVPDGWERLSIAALEAHRDA